MALTDFLSKFDLREASFLSVYICSSLLAASTYVFDTFTLNIIFRKRKTLQLSNTLVLALCWHFAYAIVTLVHCVYMGFHLKGNLPRYDHFLFCTGLLVYSIEVTIGLCNLFIAIERIAAMCWPLRYQQGHFRHLAKIALIVTLSFAAIFGIAFAVNRNHNPPRHALAFIEFIEIRVVQVLHWFDALTSIANVAITSVFLNELRKYMKISRIHSVGNCEGTFKVNKIVNYQVVSEVCIISIPILATSIYNFAWNTSLPKRVGPYPITLAALHTAICALLVYFRMRI